MQTLPLVTPFNQAVWFRAQDVVTPPLAVSAAALATPQSPDGPSSGSREAAALASSGAAEQAAVELRLAPAGAYAGAALAPGGACRWLHLLAGRMVSSRSISIQLDLFQARARPASSKPALVGRVLLRADRLHIVMISRLI